MDIGFTPEKVCLCFLLSRSDSPVVDARLMKKRLKTLALFGPQTL